MHSTLRRSYYSKSENVLEVFESNNEVRIASFEFSKKEPGLHKALSVCLYNTDSHWKNILENELDFLKSLMREKVCF